MKNQEHASSSLSSKETFRSTNEKQMTPFGKLLRVMSRNAEDINKDLEKKYGIQNLIDSSLHINTTPFDRELGGIYEKEDIHNDEETVYALDRLNSAADVPNTQIFYKNTHGIDTVEGIVAKHRENKEVSKSNQAEMAITGLLHKILKERFLVVRTSIFDDYKNGIDNLILDKETGAIICAFDEVLENEGDRNRGASKKIEKIKKSAVLGGTRAKYGVSLKEKKVVRSPARNIPVFYLNIESKDLAELTNDLYYNNQEITSIEKRLFAHLVHSISEQKKMLESLTLPPVMQEKLKEFEISLQTLKGFIV
ncbi:MAG: hypothetical protein KBC41_00565 [Candidatus Pacebacteria bacterium]|nr:hypothetical protein [Candidatus Paceibacterota bacterium]